jgi:hypothetical protein
MKHALVALVATIVFLTGGPLAMAQRGAVNIQRTMPDYYPDTFQRAGKITGIRSRDVVIISGRKYSIDANTKLHTERTEFATRSIISMGEEVGFSFITDAANNRTITELWILPIGSVRGS